MALLYPYITYLPIEMLSAIFEAAPILPDERLEFAMSVSQVSRMWRQTAMNTTFLWSSILVLGEWVEGWLKLIESIIKLSRSDPLDITVRLYRDERDSHFEVILHQQLDIIIPEIYRWKRLFYAAFFCDDAYLFFQPLSLLSAPVLEVLEITVNTEEYDDENLSIFSGGTSMLSQITMDGMGITSCFPPISSLTSLRLRNSPYPLTLTLFKDILTASDALTHLEFHVDSLDEDHLDEFGVQGQFIDLSSLRSLRIVYPDQLHNLLRILRCPGLEVMQIDELRSPDSQPQYSYELSRFNCLRSLVLRGVDCTVLLAEFNVRELPALTHITFYRCTTSMIILNALVSATEDEETVWPLLKVISLDAVSLPHKDVDSFCEVLSYRSECGKPVECVKFDTTFVEWIDYGDYVGSLREVVHVETHW